MFPALAGGFFTTEPPGKTHADFCIAKCMVTALLSLFVLRSFTVLELFLNIVHVLSPTELK